MRCDHLLVYDDFVSNTTLAVSDCGFDERLGQFDQVALMCVLGKVPAAIAGNTAQVSVWIGHSGDGETFVPKNGAGSPVPSNAEITMTWTTQPNGPLSAWGSDPNLTVLPTPFLTLVRIHIYMTQASGPVQVRVYATLRDQARAAAAQIRQPPSW